MSFPAILPAPVHLQQNGEMFSFNRQTVLVAADSSLQAAAGLLKDCLSGCTLQRVLQQPVSNYLLLQLDSNTVPQREGYRLEVNARQVLLTAHDAEGLVHALQTFRQLLCPAEAGLLVPGCTVYDYPRYGYRGMHLDVARHFFPVPAIQKFIDLLSLYKFNRFQWHLTDDQGWRVEIPKYPRLQSVAAWRNETLIGHKKEWPRRFDGQRYGGYYTTAEIKQVLQYAHERGITVIPEIEMPGHALAVLSAYPSLGCTGGPYATAGYWGIFDDVFCAGNDSSFVFLQDVLDEVMRLFPSQYIHIGGDECLKNRWVNCPKCRQRMVNEHLQSPEQLQGYFIRRIAQYVNSRGRSIIGWDEILEGGLAPDATVMSWRGEEGALAAARQGHPVILAPESHLYFDYYQSLYPQEPLAAGGYTPLSKVYAYLPLAGIADTAVTRQVAGLQGQVWTEYITNTAQLEYLLLPRLMALSERAWSPGTRTGYVDFLQRLRRQKALLPPLAVNASANYDEINYTASVHKNILQVQLESSLPQAVIRYTLDGTKPGPGSKRYRGALSIRKGSILRAQLYNAQGVACMRPFCQSFLVHLATGAPVTLRYAPVARFNTLASALVNGITGSARYNDNQWMGFSGNDLEAVIDLGGARTVRFIGTQLLNYHWQKMWAPVLLQFLVSADGVHFREVYRQQQFSVNGINPVRARLVPVVARYIKVVGKSKGILPLGEYGAGGPALLMVDEMVVR